MTIAEAIAEVDNLKPNMYGTKDKIKWLSRLDARIYEEIVQTHERNTGEEEISFTPYTENDTDTELLAGVPYDEMYLRWMEAMIDFHNGEYGKYNNAVDMFNTSYEAFQSYYNRTHMPKGRKFKYF